MGCGFSCWDLSMSGRRHKKNKPAAVPLATAETTETAASKPRRAISRRRKWLFRLTAMVLGPLLCLMLLEAGLRVAGYGYPTSFFLGPLADGTCVTNPHFGWRFFPRALSRKPIPCSISAKPTGAIRIFILGSSAAQGVPEPAFSFGRILEVMLRARYPNEKFEVVNAAMTAINSHVVLEIARDCAAHQPDLFVVYMGNNEVVGPYGPGTVFQRWSPSRRLIRANAWLKSTRIGQLLDDAMRRLGSREPSPTAWQGMEMFTGNQVAADDPRLEAVYASFRQNLIDLFAVAHRAGATLILSTAAVNLRDCPPFASLHRPDLSPEDLAKWKSIYRSGVDLESRSLCSEALKRYEAAAKLDDRFADLQFRLGRCLAAEGRLAEARNRFILARDLDALRFRADSRLNAIVRDVAAEQAPSGTRLVDAERLLADSDSASDGILGGDLFYEHVHLTFDGNYFLAQAVMRQIESALPQLAAAGKPGPVLSRKQSAESLVLTPADEYQMAKSITEITTSRPPFTNQLDHAAHQASLRKQLAVLGRRALSPQALDEACSRYEAALERTPDDWHLHRRYGLLAMACGRYQIAVKHLRLVLEKVPLDVGSHLELGNALRDSGRIDEAIVHYRRALELAPLDSMIHVYLGNALNTRGQTDEAISCLQRAVELDPKCVTAHNSLGSALDARGRADEAIAEYKKALELDPTLATVHNNLAYSLESRGRTAEAVAEYQEALKDDPGHAIAHFNLARLLYSQGRSDDAIAHFRKAVQINPKYALAHTNLGAVLLHCQQFDEAIIHFRKALEIDPNCAAARANLVKAIDLRNRGSKRE
jgi:tetratricopeptide (TPR) repeat protein